MSVAMHILQRCKMVKGLPTAFLLIPLRQLQMPDRQLSLQLYEKLSILKIWNTGSRTVGAIQ